jgi:uncharacterized protein YcbK (DUF882 family)
MTHDDLKLGVFNAITFVISFSNMEMLLKILLLIVSIVWTALKAYESLQNIKQKKMKLTKNFSLDEFIESRFYDEESQEKVWESYNENIGELLPYLSKLANQLQVLRDCIGMPIYINISYRPVWWEHKQGRSGNSQHCLGKAADIVVPGMTPDDVADMICLCK